MKTANGVMGSSLLLTQFCAFHQLLWDLVLISKSSQFKQIAVKNNCGWQNKFKEHILHFSSRHLIDHLVSTMHCACLYPFNLSFGSLLTFWKFHYQLTTFIFFLPCQDDRFLSGHRGWEKNTLGTQLPAPNIREKLGSQRIPRVLDFCAFFHNSKKKLCVLCMCDRTVICIMSLNGKNHCCHIF